MEHLKQFAIKITNTTDSEVLNPILFDFANKSRTEGVEIESVTEGLTYEDIISYIEIEGLLCDVRAKKGLFSSVRITQFNKDGDYQSIPLLLMCDPYLGGNDDLTKTDTTSESAPFYLGEGCILTEEYGRLKPKTSHTYIFNYRERTIYPASTDESSHGDTSSQIDIHHIEHLVENLNIGSVYNILVSNITDEVKKDVSVFDGNSSIYQQVWESGSLNKDGVTISSLDKDVYYQSIVSQCMTDPYLIYKTVLISENEEQLAAKIIVETTDACGMVLGKVLNKKIQVTENNGKMIKGFYRIDCTTKFIISELLPQTKLNITFFVAP